MANKNVFQISWLTDQGKRIGVWRSLTEPEYSASYPNWCKFTRMDTQEVVSINNGLVAVEEVAANSALPVEKTGFQFLSDGSSG